MCLKVIFFFLIYIAAGGMSNQTVNVTTNVAVVDSFTLFNFTENFNVHNWIEQSDTVKDYGMSKAIMSIQKTKAYQRAIFFALINPQKNGAGFAGVRILGRYNIFNYSKLQIKCRGQGDYHGFKIILRHKGLNADKSITFEQYFTAPTNEFNIVTMQLADFKPYLMGLRINETYAMDKTMISSLGIQTYGGAHLIQKQKGPASLEIDWIRCVS